MMARETTGLLFDKTETINDNETFLNEDFSKVQLKNNGISWYFAVFLIVNAALGAGILNFGKAYDNAGGIVISTIMQSLLLLIIVGALLILAYLTDKKKSANFQDVVYSQCGKTWQTINSLCIIIYMFGCCITFFIIIGDQIDRILPNIFHDDILNQWYCQRKFTITITSIVFILPLSYPKRIDFLTYPSLFAVIAIVYIVILIPIKWAITDTKDVIIKKTPDNWTDIFTVIPVVCFGYQCHVNAVPIYTCLKNKCLKEFSKSIIASVALIFTAYQITATFGYLMFGVKVDDDLLKSFEPNDWSVLVAIIMFLIKTYTSYPLNLFCARTAIEGLWIEIFKLNNEEIINSEKKRRIIIVTVWFTVSLMIAIFVPNITVVINYLGALAGTFMFIFPGLCLMFYALERNQTMSTLVDQNDQKKFRRTTTLLIIISVFYVTFGSFIMGLVITQSLMKDLSK